MTYTLTAHNQQKCHGEGLPQPKWLHVFVGSIYPRYHSGVISLVAGSICWLVSTWLSALWFGFGDIRWSNLMRSIRSYIPSLCSGPWFWQVLWQDVVGVLRMMRVVGGRCCSAHSSRRFWFSWPSQGGHFHKRRSKSVSKNNKRSNALQKSKGRTSKNTPPTPLIPSRGEPEKRGFP